MTLSKRQIEVQCKFRINSGNKCIDIYNYLLREGVNESDANKFIESAFNNIRQDGIKTIGIGFLVVIIGIVVSLILTEATRGIYIFFAWGPVLLGIILIINGIYKLFKIYLWNKHR